MKLTLLAFAVAACLASVGVPSFATEFPTRGVADARITTVAYQPNNVVYVYGMVGVATHIILQPGEKVINHAFGDSAGWWFAASGNNIFLKPKTQHASTNLVVITNDRVYNFYLHYANWNPAGKQDFQVRFTYPHAEAVASVKAAEAAEVAKGFKGQQPVNWDYTMAGDKAIAPVHVWDNWRFTSFQFPGAKDLPQIYEVLPDGTEAIVNHNVTGPGNDTVVVHKVAAQWVLRLGSQVLSIYNQHYDPNGLLNKTGTASPDVIRTIRGGHGQ